MQCKLFWLSYQNSFLLNPFMVSEPLQANASQMAESSNSSTQAPSSNGITSVVSNLPNTTQFTLVKLDGPNYLAWVSQFLPILRSYELMRLVNGSNLVPPSSWPQPKSMNRFSTLHICFMAKKRLTFIELDSVLPWTSFDFFHVWTEHLTSGMECFG
jgi:hypothetical protein